jgi:hypothetical protein
MYGPGQIQAPSPAAKSIHYLRYRREVADYFPIMFSALITIGPRPCACRAGKQVCRYCYYRFNRHNGGADTVIGSNDVCIFYETAAEAHLCLEHRTSVQVIMGVGCEHFWGTDPGLKCYRRTEPGGFYGEMTHYKEKLSWLATSRRVDRLGMQKKCQFGAAIVRLQMAGAFSLLRNLRSKH